MNNEPIRVGLISFAHVHATAYLRDLADRPDISLIAHDPGPYQVGEERGRAFAERFGVRYVDTLEEVFEWGPRAVIITSENAHHRHLVEAAARAGCDILCEKPLATTVEDAATIRDVVAASGVRLMVAYPVRFAPSVRRVKALLDDGTLGQFVSLRGSNNGKLPLQRAWFTNAELAGGGALIDHIVHVADLMEYFIGRAPAAVSAVTNRILHADKTDVETGGLVLIEYDGGVTAAIDCSWTQPEEAPTSAAVDFTVVGTGGTVDVNVFEPRVRGISGSGRPIELPYAPDFDAILLDAFFDAVRTGADMVPGLDSGIRTLQIVAAAQESARTGSWVTLETA